MRRNLATLLYTGIVKYIKHRRKEESVIILVYKAWPCHVYSRDSVVSAIVSLTSFGTKRGPATSTFETILLTFPGLFFHKYKAWPCHVYFRDTMIESGKSM